MAWIEGNEPVSTDWTVPTVQPERGLSEQTAAKARRCSEGGMPLREWERKLIEGNLPRPDSPRKIAADKNMTSFEPDAEPTLLQQVWNLVEEEYTPPEEDDGERFANVEPFVTQVEQVYDAACRLLLKKHADYGPKNISDAPGGPMNGLIVRMWDKMARLINLTSGPGVPNYEAIEDTLIDLGNYAFIGVLVERGQWPE